MAIAYKVVTDTYESIAGGKKFDYNARGVLEDPTYPLWACSTLTAARRRAGAGYTPPVRILELAYEAEDLHVATGESIALRRLRVRGEVPVVDYASWPRIPGQRVDLAAVAELLERRVYPRLLREHGVDHWRATATNAADLIRFRPTADPDVLATFALMHDSDPEGHDDDDGKRVAVFARQLAADGTLNLTAAQLNLLERCLNDYAPHRSSNATLAVAWDSCRLDVDAGWTRMPAHAFSTAEGRRRHREAAAVRRAR